jgi:glutamate decarboxylase
MAPHTNDLKMLRVVVREDFSKNRCDALICDIKLCQGLLEEMDKDTVKRQEAFIQKHSVNSAQSTHNHSKFRVSRQSSFGSRWLLGWRYFWMQVTLTL